MAKYSLREVVFFSLLNDQTFIDESISYYGKDLSPKDRDLAYLIAQGVKRRILTLDHYLYQIQKQIRLSRKEKILMYMALYQYLFMDKIPIYAIVNETVSLVKNHISIKKAPFFNAILRKMEKTTFSLPTSDDIKSLSICYSYSKYFIKLLLQDYGLDKTHEILDVQNHVHILMARVLTDKHVDLDVVYEGRFKVIKVPDKKFLFEKDRNFYVQNATPVYLIEKLSSSVRSPSKILDLCAAPGGKLIMASQIYPKATLFANDISGKRLSLLKENLKNYQIQANLTTSDAKTYKSDQKFDLIILDVPCSNSGVLYKKSEARWRIDKTSLQELTKLQFELLKNAKDYLSPKGVIWYLTCSILFSENEHIINEAKKKLGLNSLGICYKRQPDRSGFDGGFGCALIKN